ncbi:MAG TPA: 2-hydroxyacyl-CoA dehydratase family protein [Myxococcota bacterium]|nr:2-hydroxyacyl-CoA dehydratase family protein [Myxococcota bacterium]
MKEKSRKIGFTCAYTPLAVIEAAGFTPHRILPLSEVADQAGQLLHDNICPHVKRVLDRALSGDLPDLQGVVFMNSCDAMRRLADAWRTARPTDPVTILDLPIGADDRSVAYFQEEIEKLATWLGALDGERVTGDQIVSSVRKYNQAATALERAAKSAAVGGLRGGRRALQELFNRSVTSPLDDIPALVEQQLQNNEPKKDALVPVFVFGNVLPDPDAFEMLASCGVHVVLDDLCSGSRQITELDVSRAATAWGDLSRALLSRPACARSLPSLLPGEHARRILSMAQESGARGVIAHVMKFCDPYLVRMPAIRQTLRNADIPLLTLEGDCTQRSLGQQRTRIEAFVEMIGGSPS